MKMIPSFKPEIRYGTLGRALIHSLFRPGEDYRERFIRSFAGYLGVKHAFRVPSGRTGLYLILRALGLSPGDEVILPAFTFFAVPAVIKSLGLVPVFADISGEGLTMDPEKMESLITDRTRAVIPTHLCGFICGMDKISAIAQKYKLAVIEDCAQSMGARYRGRRAGALGHASYFTFGITKKFTSISGGMVATDDDRLAGRIREEASRIRETSTAALSKGIIKALTMKTAVSFPVFPFIYLAIRAAGLFGMDIIDLIFRERDHIFRGVPASGLMNSAQSRIGCIHLKDLDRDTGILRQNGIYIYTALSAGKDIRVPRIENDIEHSFSSYPVFVKEKKKARRYLLRKGIDTSGGYMQDCSSLEVFGKKGAPCPNAAEAERTILHLPGYTGLSGKDMEYMVNTLIHMGTG